MSITNVSKPSTSYANVARPDTGLTLAQATMTWAAQLDTWAESGSLLNNISRVSSSITNQAKP